MFEIQQIRELKARKAFLVSECALDRSLIASETALFEQKTKWPQLLFLGIKTALPRMQFLLPVAGWLIARGIGSSRKKGKPSSVGSVPNIVGIFRKGMVAWQLFKKGRQFWSQWREQRDLGRLKSAN